MPITGGFRRAVAGAWQRLSGWKTCAALVLALPVAAWAADPQIAALVDDPDPVTAGGLYTYVVRVDNNANDVATNTRLRLSVPAGAEFVSAAPASQNCVATTATQIDCNLGNLGGLGNDVRNLVFTWRATVPGLATIEATAEVQADNDPNPANNVQTQTTTVTSGANLSLTMGSVPSSVAAGAHVTYLLVARNAGPNVSGDVAITVNLSPSASHVAVGGPGWVCEPPVGLARTCRHAGPHPVGQALPQLNVEARVTAASGTITSSASVLPDGPAGTTDPDLGNNAASENTVVTPGADVLVRSLSVLTGDPATAGSTVRFLISPRNDGPSSASGVTLTDTLPAGWTLVSADGPGWTCSTAGLTATCTRATYPSGAGDDITLVAVAPGSAAVGPTGTTYSHSAQIGSTTTDTDTRNNSQAVSIRVLPAGADLAISKLKTPSPVAVGGTLTSRIVVSNLGPQVATGPLRVVDLLGEGETYAGFSGAGWSCSSSLRLVTCSHPNSSGLAVGASLRDLEIRSIAAVAGLLGNNACTGNSVPAGAVGATASPPVEGDPNAGNDCAGASARATTSQPDLAITKTTTTPLGGDKLLAANEAAVTYTLVVRNVSASADVATGIVITDNLPAFLVGRSSVQQPVVASVSAGTATFACAVSGADVTCTQTGGALAPGQSVTVPITVNRPLAEGAFTNTATVRNTAEGDPNAANDTASDTVTIGAVADVAMTGKTVTPASVRAGETARYVLSLRNNGPAAAADVVVSDTFDFAATDAGFTVLAISPSQAGASCSIAPGAVLRPGNNRFSCNLGTLANGQAESITLVVRPNWQSGNPARSIGNTAAITTSSIENPDGGDNGNNRQSATLAVLPAELDVLVNTTDIVDPVPFTAGSTFLDYRVRVTSNGPSYGTGVRFTETMTPQAGRSVRFVCDTTTAGGSVCNSPSLCSVTGVTSAPGVAIPAFTCTVPAGTSSTGLAVGDLASGQSKDVFLRFQVLDQPSGLGDVYDSTASAQANEADVFLANNTEVERTTTRQRIDLRVSKSASLPTVSLRQPFNWVIRVENRGPGNSLQTDLTDSLPAGTELTGPVSFTRTRPAGSGNCSVSGLAVSCSLGQLDASGESTVTVPVRIVSYPASGTVVNSATVDDDPAKTGAINIPGGNNTGQATVAVVRSSIAGTVFDDRDRSGANGGVPQDGTSEPRLAGVAIRLTGTDAYGNPVDLGTSTDASGNYNFTDLSPAGTTGYTITETQPVTHLNSPVAVPDAGANAPSAGGSYAAGGSNGNSVYSSVLLPADTAALRYNFPEVQPARLPGLSGFVYIDSNGNGSRDSTTDAPIAGATVRLLDAATGALVASTTTDATGAYQFSNLEAGRRYTLEQPLPSTPAGLSNGPVNPGLVGGVACTSGCTAQPDSPAAGTDRIANIDLSAGTDGTQFNFGERQLALISGVVFIDRDGDTNRSPGEPALPGVTLRLVQGADCASGTTLTSTTSAADGSWQFTGLRAGADYRVCETQPAGYGTGSANGTPGRNEIAVPALPLAGATGNRFGETVSSLAGAVYVDSSPATPANTNNGVRDSGEAGLAGVTLTLSGTDANGEPVNRTTTTDASGNYRFDDLLASGAGGYSVVEGAIPAAAGSFSDGRDSAGSAGGSTATNDQISAVVLAAGTQATGYNFGELPLSPPPPTASVSGTVFIDRNRDGTMDPAPTDGRLPGVVLTLYPGSSCSGTPLASTTTDASGNFRFADLTAGATYTVCETQPAGYADGPINPGPNGSSTAPNSITVTSLPTAGAAGLQLGERLGSLSGAVYVDSSPATPANTNNGVRDSGEAGLAGVTLTLSGTDANGEPVNRTTTTDASGNYRFDDLLASGAGGYSVVEGAIPAAAGSFSDGRDSAGSAGGSTATNDQISAVVLAAGTQATGYNFGELPLSPAPATAAISGTVFIDRNRDGTMDPAPTDGRLPGVVLTLYPGSSCSGTPLATTTTDASGNFRFADLPAGATYTVCETQPTGYADGPINPGPNGSSTSPNSITVTSLPTAGAAGLQFGERLGSLAGTVYLDANNDGQRQSGEVGIAAVTVTLSGTDAQGNAISRSTSTNASGGYRFDDLPAAGGSGYTVTEQAAQPAVAGVTTLDGRSTAGTVAAATLGSASAPTSLPSRITGVLLPAGADGVAYDFGEILPSSISGQVYLDGDGNGQPGGATDSGLPGATLVLTGTDDTGAPVSLSVVTGPDGRFTVPDLRPGSYTLTQPAQPAATSEGRTSPGSAGGSVGPVGPGQPSTVTGIALGTPGTAATGYNFAELPATGAIAGLVWLDANANGSVEPTEAGIAGVTLSLVGTDLQGRAVNQSTTTDANGAYRFANLPAGNYTVTEPAQPTGTLNGLTRAGSNGGTPTVPTTTPSAIAGIGLAAGQLASANNFGEIPPASLSGQVFIDGNGNGSPDSGEPGLPGITLVLTGTDDLGQPVSTTTTTGPDGSYQFPGLRPGTYTVTQPTQPAGTVNGATTPGPLGGTATPVGTTPSAVAGILLPAGGAASGNHFAEQSQSPDLRVSESHSPATLTVGGSASYPISVRNAGDLATSGSYTVEGRLPSGLTLTGTPAGNGWACSGAVGATGFSCVSSAVLVPGAVHPGQIVVPVAVGAAALPASPVSAWVLVDGGGESAARRPTADERNNFDSNPAALPVCLPGIVHNACREPAPVQAPAAVSGTVWFDRGSATRLLDAGDTRLPGWGVEVLDVATGQTIGRATTAADGSYRVDGLQPGVALAVRFRDPASGVVFGYPVNGETAVGASGASCVSGTPPAGTPSSCTVAGATPQLVVVLAAGQLLPQQSLPVDPSGVVYDAVQRSPVAGATVALAPVGACAGWDPASAVVGATLGGYTVSGSSIAMTVGASGFYQFQLAPAAPASCTFGLTVTPPTGYQSPSTLIPATAGPLLPPGAAGSVFAVQPQADAPTGAVGTATTYYLTLTTGSAGVSVVHNHIPLDPLLPNAVSLSKTGDKSRAEVGDTVRYTISVALPAGTLAVQTTVVDRLPAGFTYIAGTASVNDVPIADPAGGVGPTLAFNLGPAPASGRLVLRYRVRVGVGAAQGDGVNRASAYSCAAPLTCVGPGLVPVAGAVASNEGLFRVMVSGGVFGDEACVLGKVFIDCNNNHVQDREELGIPGVRLVMSDGTTLISDSEGKYSVCGLPPRSHVLRIDPLTLPQGARLTTSSNRNLGDAGSLWLDLKNGELHRADFVEGSCSNTVLEQTKARRAQGEVRAPETERKTGPALRFDSKAHGRSTLTSPQQGTDGANQQAPKPRQPAAPAPGPTQDAQNQPTPNLPMNRPPPTGRSSGTAPDAAANGGSNGTR